MIRLQKNLLSVLCLWTACSPSSEEKDFLSSQDTGQMAGNPNGGELFGEEILSPRDKVSEIAASGQVLYYSTQYDPSVYALDLDNMQSEKVTWGWRGLTGFTAHSGRFYGSFTDSSVEGWVSELIPPKTEEEWASKGSDGTLFREPAGPVVYRGKLAVVERKTGDAWLLEGPGGGSFRIENVSAADTLLVHENELLYGGPEGVFSSEGRLDKRAALGLTSHGEEIWGTHPDHGLFEVGGAAWGLPELARPGSVVFLNAKVWVVDDVAGSLWAFDIPSQ